MFSSIVGVSTRDFLGTILNIFSKFPRVGLASSIHWIYMILQLQFERNEPPLI